MAVAGADPAFGLIGPDGRRRLWQEGTQPDLRGQRADKSVALAVDGRRVRFKLGEYGGSSWVLFDLVNEQLSEAPGPQPDLSAADTTSLPISDWINNRDPKFNGASIKLDNFETARSVAIAPDRQMFVLGSEWTLRGFDKDGRQVWRTQTPGATWSRQYLARRQDRRHRLRRWHRALAPAVGRPGAARAVRAQGRPALGGLDAQGLLHGLARCGVADRLARQSQLG